MKYVTQFGVILLFSLLGEVLNLLIPAPIPASIYGFALLLLALQLRLVRLEAVAGAGDYLISLLPLILTPVSVGILESGEAVKEMLLPTVIISVFTTVLVMAVTGLVTQKIIRVRRKRHERVAG